jgi:3-hydroxyisobutyrate dehydrogenase-like beta-hydroxyacid dehydrogenase
MKIAFIGLGRMGSGMARNLLRAGHGVTVYNRSREKADALAADGASVAASPGEACEGVEVAVTMLADDRAVEEVVLGESGMAAGLAKDAIHISSSTISTALARRLASGHAAIGQGFVSAPVFGRPDAAAEAKLVVVAAGPEELISRCRPLFDAIGRQTCVAGSEPWQANAVKLCGNFMIAAMLEAFGESFAVLRKASVEPRLFVDVMTALFKSPVYANYGRNIAEERFEPAGFALKLGLKDIRLTLENADQSAAPMPLASVIRDQLISAMALGQGELDWSSVSRISARNAGL